MGLTRMTDQTGGDQPQKTVAELLAEHGAQVDGGRRRRRRAADDDEAPETTGRRAGPSDTAPQAIIDRINSGGATPPPPPPSAPPPPVPPAPQRPAAARRRPPTGPAPVPPPAPKPVPAAEKNPPPVPPAPRPVPQESQQLPRPVKRPAPGSAESGQYARPQESGTFARPPQESGQYAVRPPQESGQLPLRPQESAQLPVPPRESTQLPVPPRGRNRPQPPAAPPSEQETRSQVQPVRHRPAAPPPGPPPQSGALSARLDGAEADAPDAPSGPMASGKFATPPPAGPRQRRGPARRPQPKEAFTEQFDAVGDSVEPEPPRKASPPKPTMSSKIPEIGAPSGLANWRKKRKQEQLEDTEIGVMPAVPVEDDFPADDFAPDKFAQDSGYQADPYDGGPPTGTYPPPMPFAPGERRSAIPDELSEYERAFAEPGYPDGPDFDRDDYGYEQGDGYEDEYDEGVDEQHEEPAAATSPGKQWLALAVQLALGVAGGAAVWLGFNWLWVNLPAAALIAALVVVVALVWIVRKIRRAEDLQTTVLAVLVGLVVTVSPAALLLVSK